MTDLDARVVALMKMAFACSGDTLDWSMLQQAIRAELQKPALHEPIDVEESANSIQRDLCELEPYNPAAVDAVCVDLVSLQLILQRNLESVLQGRAKPAQNNLAGLLAALYYGQYSTNEDKKSLDKSIELALKNYDIGSGEFVQPAQEEITDAHRALIEAADAVLKNEEHAVSCGARSYQKGSPTWEVYKELDACIRASKGEKT